MLFPARPRRQFIIIWWRRNHRAQGARAHTFTNGWARWAPRGKLETDQNVLPITKSAYQNDYLYRKVEKHDKNIFRPFVPPPTLHFQIHSDATVIISRSHRIGGDFRPFMLGSDAGRRRCTLDTLDRRATGARLRVVPSVLVFCGTAASAQRRHEQRPERAAEQSTHRAVEQEVDGAVDEHENVPDVAERGVHVVEDVWLGEVERTHVLDQPVER